MTPKFCCCQLAAKSGERVHLSAQGSIDPDGNALSYEWIYYGEPGGPLPLQAQEHLLPGQNYRYPTARNTVFANITGVTGGPLIAVEWAEV